MRKIVFMLVACAAMMVSCNNGKNKTVVSQSDTMEMETPAMDSAVYEGLMPAADCFGIRYRLALATDSTKGYSLMQDYMNSETEVKQSFSNEGTYEEMEKDGKNYLKIVVPEDEMSNLYLLKVDESTLRLVNSDLEESESKDMNYDLKLAK